MNENRVENDDDIVAVAPRSDDRTFPSFFTLISHSSVVFILFVSFRNGVVRKRNARVFRQYIPLRGAQHERLTAAVVFARRRPSPGVSLRCGSRTRTASGIVLVEVPADHPLRLDQRGLSPPSSPRTCRLIRPSIAAMPRSRSGLTRSKQPELARQTLRAFPVPRPAPSPSSAACRMPCETAGGRRLPWRVKEQVDDPVGVHLDGQEQRRLALPPDHDVAAHHEDRDDLHDGFPGGRPCGRPRGVVRGVSRRAGGVSQRGPCCLSFMPPSLRVSASVRLRAGMSGTRATFGL